MIIGSLEDSRSDRCRGDLVLPSVRLLAIVPAFPCSYWNSVQPAGQARAARPSDSRGVPMLTKPFLSQVLGNDALTRGLGDPEARVLVEWLVEQVERQVGDADTEALAQAEVQRLYRRARAIGRFVDLWCHFQARGAAGQLAAAERFTWPLPEAEADPCELMQNIVDWETRQLEA